MAVTLDVFGGIGVPAVMSTTAATVQVTTSPKRFRPAVDGSVMFAPGQPYQVLWEARSKRSGWTGLSPAPS